MTEPRTSKPPSGTPNVDLTDDDQSSTPHMPHDRDERVGMTDNKPSETIRKAHDDVERGVKDTTRGTEADAAYKKLKTGR